MKLSLALAPVLALALAAGGAGMHVTQGSSNATRSLGNNSSAVVMAGAEIVLPPLPPLTIPVPPLPPLFGPDGLPTCC